MRSMNYDKIVVVDVEATCWRGPPPAGQSNQIIEIGATLLDTKTWECSNKKSFLVKPSKSTVSSFCTELTGITQEMLDSQGMSFRKACDLLVSEFNSHKRVWASYGEYDKSIFRKNCSMDKVNYPFSKQHLNVKVLFALKEQLTTGIGMEKALARIKMPLEGKHHRGDDDSWNTAKLLAYCFKQPA